MEHTECRRRSPSGGGRSSGISRFAHGRRGRVGPVSGHFTATWRREHLDLRVLQWLRKPRLLPERRPKHASTLLGEQGRRPEALRAHRSRSLATTHGTAPDAGTVAMPPRSSRDRQEYVREGKLHEKVDRDLNLSRVIELPGDQAGGSTVRPDPTQLCRELVRPIPQGIGKCPEVKKHRQRWKMFVRPLKDEPIETSCDDCNELPRTHLPRLGRQPAGDLLDRVKHHRLSAAGRFAEVRQLP